jgi:hypothetical protein
MLRSRLTVALGSMVLVAGTSPVWSQDAAKPDAPAPAAAPAAAPADAPKPDAPAAPAGDKPADAPAAPAPAPAGADLAPSGAPGGKQVSPEIAKGLSMWEDFIHYLRIAQLDLAVSSGKALLGAGLKPEDLLAVVEDISPYRDYQATLSRGSKLEGEPGAVTKQVAQLIEDARLALARDGARVRANIEQLDDGLRPRLNAQARLKRAGEYAAPQMLAVIVSTADKDQTLRPYVIEALVNIGRPVVAPLSEALSGLPAVPKQQVAEILARIGYPLALPYLKAELARNDIDAATRNVLQVAFDRIISRTPISPATPAADLFLLLGEDYYNRRESLVLDPAAQFNLMWTYDAQRGLNAERIPTPIFGDVMAMRAARRALNLNKELSSAASLWIAANFRRQNNLPQGATDPSYGPDMRSPHFYATLAGPRHVQPVLARALEERDAALALDAIRALATTSGTPALLNLDGDKQPLIAALGYPDRRVRFEAAYTLARAKPHVPFSGSQRVVPVLAEAIREAGKQIAVVIADNTDQLNATAKMFETAGYQPIVGNSFEAVVDQVANAPGVDVVVINGSGPKVESAIANAHRHFKTAASPVILFTSAEQLPTYSRAFGPQGVTVVNAAAELAQIQQIIAGNASRTGGPAINEEQAKTYAMTSLSILHDLANEVTDVFPIVDAKAALIDGLKDPRKEVALAAADVLSNIPSEDAQRALADAGLDEARGAEQQVPFLRALAAHARRTGNLLTNFQLDKLAQMVNTATGDLADAAAEVHGSLNLPTSAAVDRISGGK